MAGELYRELPSVEQLLSDERVRSLAARHGRPALAEIAREVLDESRALIAREGRAAAVDHAGAVVDRAGALEPTLRRVINATGVLLHTNLGRAPLSQASLEAVAEVGRGYSTLELDAESGRRGSRAEHVRGLLRRLTGAEDGLAVNNNAGAVLLALAALAAGREVVISRGELVEIGGGFRIPDVLRQSGARLVEVGTTNRTYVADYAQAITAETAAILRVHASNFRLSGFTERPALPALSALAHERGLLLIDDLGSGSLVDTGRYGLAPEPTVPPAVAAGADVVLFSGDKLLGGPQAGIAVGRSEPIARLRSHPLARALRIDKLSLAGLAATLAHYARGEAASAVPLWRLIARPVEELEARARRWALAAGEGATVIGGRSMIGGGALPEESIATVLLALEPAGGAGGGADALAGRLRAGDPPVIARIEDGRVLLDPRTVEPGDDAAVAAAVARAAGRGRGAAAGRPPGGGRQPGESRAGR